jgi:hypothetical protein
VRAQWIDVPSFPFYGVGTESQLGEVTHFLYRSTTAGVSGKLQATRFAAVGANLDFLDFRTGAGKRETSVEQRFTTADTPGLGESPRYTRSQVFAEFDWRQSPGYTTSGGLAPAGLAGISSDFIRILLGASGGPNPSWEHPVQAYFRREAGGWRLVGFERLPLTAETFRLSYSRPRRCTVRARACRHEWLKLRV